MHISIILGEKGKMYMGGNNVKINTLSVTLTLTVVLREMYFHP